MRRVIEYLNFHCGDYVIVGSLALYIHNVINTFSKKDIDIVIDVPYNEYDYNSNWMKRKDRFSGWGWTTRIDDYYIDVFNTELPNHHIEYVDDLKVNIITLSALKKHYNTLDIPMLGGHLNFRKKMMARCALFN